ncbi:hypothetical protein [Flavobacterium davisii]|uniref:Peptidoglycan binding-like domain-containing protein n=1 Tax=Flavobacterium columnare TaxID=996 RepID=A0A8G0KVR4_9FLAO|nr:hypothetical protein [Flavobacterium davisii]QYS88669.1 hypothetical protein JJC05_13960 [Flavobacterium davisii]
MGRRRKRQRTHASNKLIDTKKAKVDLYGNVVVDFMLTKALMKKAMQGETDIRELEFYVTVEYYKNKKHTTANVDIQNPLPTENKPPSQSTGIKKAKGSPAEEKPKSKKEESGLLNPISETLGEIWDWVEPQETALRDKPHTIEIPEGKSPAIVGKTKVEKASTTGTSCGERYCIKKGDKSELIREINIRLAGFGGNVPTDEFTDRTEKMIKQFQRDYMKVPETGKVCGNVLRAIDDFCNKWHENISEYTCLCKNVRSITNKCSGFGKERYKDQYNSTPHVERYHKYERPGIHRTLLWGVSALRYYLSQQSIYKYLHKTAGYRCWEHNNHEGRLTTNHMGKAVDIQFSKNGEPIVGKKSSNLPLLKEIRDKFYEKYLDTKYQWVDGKNNFSLEPFGLSSGTTWSWVHMDVREFENKFLEDIYFIKTQNLVIGKPIIQLAQELGYLNVCICNSSGFKPQEKKSEENKNRRVDPKTLKTSDKGINFIKDWESFKSNLYNDDSDEHHCTIGYGHLVHRGPCNGNESEEFKKVLQKKKPQNYLSLDYQNLKKLFNVM